MSLITDVLRHKRAIMIAFAILCLMAGLFVARLTISTLKSIDWSRVGLVVLVLAATLGAIWLAIKASRKSSDPAAKKYAGQAAKWALGIIAVLVLIFWVGPKVAGWWDELDAPQASTAPPAPPQPDTFTLTVRDGQPAEAVIPPGKVLDYWFDTKKVSTRVEHRGPNKVQIYTTMKGVGSAQVYNCRYPYQARVDCSR